MNGIEGVVLKALSNYGADTSCGACMEVAFTGVTTNMHTCKVEEKYLTKEEIGTLYNYLKNEYVTYSDGPVYELMKKISKIANEKLKCSE